jgi:hypothetical protein
LPEDLFSGLPHPLELLFVTLIKEDQGMEIPVTRVGQDAYLNTVLLRYPQGPADHFGQPGDRNGGVLDHSIRPEARDLC